MKDVDPSEERLVKNGGLKKRAIAGRQGLIRFLESYQRVFPISKWSAFGKKEFCHCFHHVATVGEQLEV